MTPIEQAALEFAAERLSSEWPERCQEIVRRARAALASLEAQEPQWRPIETAPEGVRGMRILAVVGGEVRLVAWGKTSHLPWVGWCLADQGPEDFDLCRPTHWMPLPAAPSPGSGT